MMPTNEMTKLWQISGIYISMMYRNKCMQLTLTHKRVSIRYITVNTPIPSSHTADINIKIVMLYFSMSYLLSVRI